MSRAVELLCSRRVPQLAVLALMSFAFAGCSADMQSRLSQTSNPFGPQEATGSVPPRDVPAYSRPQPYQSQSYQPQAYPQQQPYQPPQPYQSSALPPISAPQSYAAAQPATYAPKEHTPPASVGVTGGGRGVASYSPPAYSPPAYTAPSRPPLEATASIAPRSVAAARTPTPTSTKIIVGTSDTLEILAHRYNVPAAAIMQANNLKGPRALSPGQQLIIPHSASAVAAATPALAPPASKPVAVAAVAPNTHVVGHGDTLLSIARRNHVSLPDLARANNLNPSSKLSLGEKIVVPASRVAAATRGCHTRCRSAARRGAGAAGHEIRCRRNPAEGPAGAGRAECGRARGRVTRESRRVHRRSTDFPLAGAWQGDHRLWRQGQRQSQ